MDIQDSFAITRHVTVHIFVQHPVYSDAKISRFLDRGLLSQLPLGL